MTLASPIPTPALPGKPSPDWAERELAGLPCLEIIGRLEQRFGGKAGVGRALLASRQCVHQWKKRGLPSQVRVLALLLITNAIDVEVVQKYGRHCDD